MLPLGKHEDQWLFCYTYVNYDKFASEHYTTLLQFMFMFLMCMSTEKDLFLDVLCVDCTA